MKKGVLFIWDDACQKAFEEIKWYLAHWSRTSIQPDRKGILGIGIHRPEDATLLGRLNHTRRIKSQSFKIAYNEAIITEWSTGKMGHVALLI